MKGARKGAAPADYAEWLGKANEDWTPSYPFPADIKEKIVEALRREQRGLCVYCGCRLDLRRQGKTFHIEHFRPQHAYPADAVAHSNLFLSCGQEDSEGNRSETCGTKKDRWFDEALVIEPEYFACTGRFRFKLNGTVEPIDAADDAAKEWIVRLNLNHRELAKERETLLAKLDENTLDLADLWDVESTEAESFAHVAYQYFRAVLP